MIPQRYPIGIQTFSKIIENGYTYIDKTRFIPMLLEGGQYIFLSRPRRFGKSLMLSTLHSFFDGDRELFKGLDIDSMDVDWSGNPVIHIDLNAENYTLEDGLSNILDRILREYELKYGVSELENTLSGRFSRLIKVIHETTKKQVVILVDEYDKPLLEIEGNLNLFEKNQAILKSFFGVLKSLDRYIRFAILTGVARFNKVSVFSDLNNLRDISLSDKFADICGWTHEELMKAFTPSIQRLADSWNMSLEEATETLREFYDGYKFAPRGSLLYNPFSVLNALADEKFGYYWFQTGTPTFLARRVQKSALLLESLNYSRCSDDQLLSVGINDPNPIPLLFQTGYLTIKSANGHGYELHFPNKEVETGFARQLQPLYLPQMSELNGTFSIWEFQREISEGKVDEFMNRLCAMVKAVPYEQHSEKFYQNLIYILFTLLGADARVEEHTNIGRTDLVVRTYRFIYIFEFKYNGSAKEALEQIRQRDYAGRFSTDSRELILIGANFSTSARGLDSWIISGCD